MQIKILCDGGLANRLQSLISGLYLGDLLHMSKIVYWPSNNWCAATLEDILDVKNLSAAEIRATALSYLEFDDHVLFLHNNQFEWRGILINPNKVKKKERLTDVLRYGGSRWRRIFRKEILDPRIVYYNDRFPPWFDSSGVGEARYIDRIRFREEIESAARSLLEAHGLEPRSYYGIHLRGTDFRYFEGLDWEKWYAYVQENLENNYFICSDEREIEERFSSLPNCFVNEKRSYAKKLDPNLAWTDAIVDSEGREFPFNVYRDKESILEACTDLLLLSCSKIIRTSSSSFLRLASVLGRQGAVCPPSVSPEGN